MKISKIFIVVLLARDIKSVHSKVDRSRIGRPDRYKTVISFKVVSRVSKQTVIKCGFIYDRPLSVALSLCFEPPKNRPF